MERVLGRGVHNEKLFINLNYPNYYKYVSVQVPLLRDYVRILIPGGC